MADFAGSHLSSDTASKAKTSLGSPARVKKRHESIAKVGGALVGIGQPVTRPSRVSTEWLMSPGVSLLLETTLPVRRAGPAWRPPSANRWTASSRRQENRSAKSPMVCNPVHRPPPSQDSFLIPARSALPVHPCAPRLTGHAAGSRASDFS